MRRIWPRCSPHHRHFATKRSAVKDRPPLVRIDNATFYRHQPSPNPTEEEALINRQLFPKLQFELQANDDKKYWAVVGASNAGKTTFLEIVRGQHLCFPPTARTYPYLSTEELAAKDPRLRYPGRAIQYVGFDNKPGGLSGVGTYLSARYESRREVTDFSLQDFLLGNTQLNPGEQTDATDLTLLERVANDLRLLDLMKMPVSNLSHGQTRRARIAKALLGKPEILLLDEPFMGLDPPTTVHLSPLLGRLAAANNPRILLALRPQDPIPDWITHVLFLAGEGQVKVAHKGTVENVSAKLMKAAQARKELPKDVEFEGEALPLNYSEFGRRLSPLGPMPDAARQSTNEQKRKQMQTAQKMVKQGDRDPDTLIRAGIGEALLKSSSWSRYAYPLRTYAYQPRAQLGEPVIEMDGVTVRYGEKTVLGGWRQEGQKEDGMFWTVRKGDRWGVFGPNGSGKTTLLSMITSDHPQAYSQPLKMFGRHRLPSQGMPGLSVFELQARIGHSSPEVHSFFPRKLTVRQSLESAFADTPLSKPRALTADADAKIDACLRWFQPELNPAKGWNENLLHDAKRRSRPSMLEYAAPGNKEEYKEKTNAYWYDVEQADTVSVDWADHMLFGEMPFSAQRVCLFLRAIIRQPDVVILDEAFGGMDDYVRDKCLLFLDHGESRSLTPVDHKTRDYTSGPMLDRSRTTRESKFAIMPGLSEDQALIVVSHIKEEIPESVRDWIYLPEAARVGKDESPAAKCRIGTCQRSMPRSARLLALRSDEATWAEIWGMNVVVGEGRRSVKNAERTGERAFLWSTEAMAEHEEEEAAAAQK